MELDGIDRKLRRAEEHLDTFKVHETRWENHQREYIVVLPESDAESEGNGLVQFIMRVEAVVPIEKIVPLIVGDCVQNMRSALDHLAYQLVIANDGTPNTYTAFPIFSSRTNDAGKERELHVPGGVDPGALTLIDAAQPYQRTDPTEITAHPLMILKELSNIDKHRLVIVMGETAGATWIEAGMGGGGGSPIKLVGDVQRRIGQPLKPGAMLGGIGTRIESFIEHPHVKGEVTLHISFGQSEFGASSEPVGNLLQELLEAVRGIIDSLRFYTLPASHRTAPA